MKFKNAEEAINAYIERFGGFPGFVFAYIDDDDEEMLEAIAKAIKTGEELKPPYDDVDY